MCSSDLESTFVGVWAFGWKRLSPKMHCVAAWLVAIAGNLSAVWIILANGFMQNPKGFEIVEGAHGPKAVLVNFWEVLGNSFAWQQFIHTIAAAAAMSGFFVMGVAAYHLLKKNETDLFARSFRMGAVVALFASLLVAGQGHFHGNEVAELQPAKLAAMEAHFETQKNAPMYLLVIPGEEENLLEAIPVPSLLSILAFNDPDAEVVGLNDIPKEDRPPVVITHLAFRIMVGIGTLMILVAAFGWLKRKKIGEYPLYLKVLPWFIPLPYIAIQAGWVVAEVGRQPWIVYNLMRTADAVSPVQGSQVGFSLVAMCLLYTLLGFAGIYLMIRYARKGPEA